MKCIPTQQSYTQKLIVFAATYVACPRPPQPPTAKDSSDSVGIVPIFKCSPLNAANSAKVQTKINSMIWSFHESDSVMYSSHGMTLICVVLYLQTLQYETDASDRPQRPPTPRNPQDSVSIMQMSWTLFMLSPGVIICNDLLVLFTAMDTCTHGTWSSASSATLCKTYAGDVFNLQQI